MRRRRRRHTRRSETRALNHQVSDCLHATCKDGARIITRRMYRLPSRGILRLLLAHLRINSRSELIPSLLARLGQVLLRIYLNVRIRVRHQHLFRLSFPSLLPGLG